MILPLGAIELLIETEGRTVGVREAAVVSAGQSPFPLILGAEFMHELGGYHEL